MLLVAAGVLATSSLFTVDQTEQALVLQFGQPVRVIARSGPVGQAAVRPERHLLRQAPARFRAAARGGHPSDQQRLVVDSYTRFRINDPLLFYQTVGTEEGVRARLTSIVSGSLRRVLGNDTLLDVLSAERAAIMGQIRDQVNTEAKNFGVEVVDVRIRRADLPAENSEAILARMQSEREQQAAQARAEGAEAAQTPRQRRTRAHRDAGRGAARRQKLRGEGEAESTAIYADAFGQDKAFFAFWRSMEAYKRRLQRRRRPRSSCRPKAISSATSAGGPAPAAPNAAATAPSAAQRPRRLRAPIVPPANASGRRDALMRDLETALALVLVIEGILYALWRRTGCGGSRSRRRRCRPPTLARRRARRARASA